MMWRSRFIIHKHSRPGHRQLNRRVEQGENTHAQSIVFHCEGHKKILDSMLQSSVLYGFVTVALGRLFDFVFASALGSGAGAGKRRFVVGL